MGQVQSFLSIDRFRLSSGTRLDLAWWLRNPALESGESFLLVFWRIFMTDTGLERSHENPVSAADFIISVVSSPDWQPWKLRHLAMLHRSILLEGFLIQVQSENVTAAAYINLQWGTKSLPEARSCPGSCLPVSHVPSLHPEVFQYLCYRWGMSDVDLPGSNNRLNGFVSR